MIILEKVVEHKSVGWSALPCACCEKVRAFEIESIHEVKKIWTIPYASKEVGLKMTCDFCGFESIAPTERRDTSKILPSWAPDQGLQVLVDATLPGAVISTEGAEPLDSELDAIMGNIAAKAQSQAATGGLLGAVVGVFVGMGVFGYLALAFQIGGEFWWITGAVGALGSMIAGTLWHRRLVAKRLIRRGLELVMVKHHLPVRRLADYARESASSPPVVKSVLVQMNDRMSNRTAVG